MPGTDFAQRLPTITALLLGGAAILTGCALTGPETAQDTARADVSDHEISSRATPADVGDVGSSDSAADSGTSANASVPRQASPVPAASGTTPPGSGAASVAIAEGIGTPLANADAATHFDNTAADTPDVPLPPTDLIDRIRRTFVLPTATEAAVERELGWFISNADYVERVLNRAAPYLHYIVEELERREMPLDLALLPIVESAFDPFAYSHGRASGLWQIIPGTGRRLGLKQNWWFDGRRDIPESTRAALDYLELLHEQFDGDWLLAVAGYNSGEGNVARALRRAEASGRPLDFWGIRADLPVETRTYVPRLIAIRDLVADPGAHGVELPALADEPAFVQVRIGSQIDMALAANLARLDIDTLYAFNPGINRWATDPEGPHRLLIPVAQADRFARELEDLGERERVRWTRHRIQRGETLSQLAEKYQTTPAVLRDINGIAGNMIRAGDHLMIPHASAASDAYSQSVDARSERQRNRERDGRQVTHTVRSGESFWSISRLYDVGVRELASWNAMAPGDVLSVGRELTVWTNTDVRSANARNPALPTAPANQIRRINYVVRRGDSLASIAQRFRVTVTELVRWNDIDPKRYLQPGQRLVMHVDVTEQSS